jgi:hypothetical protein
MSILYENLSGNSVGRIELTFHRREILKIVKSMCNSIKNQMHAYEMSYKCELHSPHIVATYIFVCT